MWLTKKEDDRVKKMETGRFESCMVNYNRWLLKSRDHPRDVFSDAREKKKEKKQGKSKTLAKLPRNQVSQRTMKFKCSMRATARQFNNKSNINRKACQFLRYSLCHVLSSPSTNPFRIVYVLLHRRTWNKNTGRLI